MLGGAALADDALEHFEPNLVSHRRLDPALRDVDLQLQRWAAHACSWYAAKGFPLVPGEAGVKAPAAPARAWPPPVLALDELIGGLHWPLAAAVLAHYANPDRAMSERLQAYQQLAAHFLARLPPAEREPLPPNISTFRTGLDRARWTLRYAVSR